MENSNKPAIPLFWQNWLSKLKETPTLCIVGYDFHSEYYMPHFNDTICGVWSKPDASLNPFTSEQSYYAVMHWMSWRKHTINKFEHPERIPRFANLYSLGQFRELQQLFGFGIADQSPDGLLTTNHLTDVYEIYGNINRAKCHSCDQQVEQWQYDQSTKQVITCPRCGGRVFPDICMFGWNDQQEIKAKLSNKLNEADSLLCIAPDKTLFPFLDCEAVIKQKKMIEIMPKAIVFDHGKQTVHIKELARILGWRDSDVEALNNSPATMAESLSIFHKFCMAWAQGVITDLSEAISMDNPDRV